MSIPKELTYKVKTLYKQLLYIGKEYPAGFAFFRPRLKSAFLKKRNLQTAEEVEKAIKQGEFVYKELETLWFLKK
ncbi:LYR motif-containing protein 5 [Rhizophlyctis rosea]|uniref:LYR motif-containing protein 5 n=1 Tax=Rhizophlyctis rosea TaxID=64517 RepID=A0AAD5WYV3_9FUNG|nr:LYR motif-containing protein 5 [Rhizophlyctis rosea]